MLLDRLQHAEYIDFRFTDCRGVWHHITFPKSGVTESLLKEGIAFDGSSIPGWQPIHQSDMLLKPEMADSYPLDPFYEEPTAIVVCQVHHVDGSPYSRDPRGVAKRAEAYVASVGADTAFFGPEAEFFMFDEVRFDVSATHSEHKLVSNEDPSANVTGGMGHRYRRKGGYFPCGVMDESHDIRTAMLKTLESVGVEVEKHHHEVAPSQHELGFKFGTLTSCADHMQMYKYVVRGVAAVYGKTVTFMPKPVYGDNGSGMHVHQSLWFNQKPLFAGNEYAGLSQMALWYIGGILKHAPSLNALTNPTTNSYKRLVPGFEAPVIRAYSAHNRSASCRIPVGSSPASKRVEVRFPDPTANPYLAFAAMLMAGLDGIKNKIDPGSPQDHDLFEDKKRAGRLPSVCGSLREALNALETDHDYLLAGDVFTKDLIEAYIDLKWEEVYAYEQHPHPIEFLYSYSL